MQSLEIAAQIHRGAHLVVSSSFFSACSVKGRFREGSDGEMIHARDVAKLYLESM